MTSVNFALPSAVVSTTAAAGDSDTSYATTAFVDNAAPLSTRNVVFYGSTYVPENSFMGNEKPIPFRGIYREFYGSAVPVTMYYIDTADFPDVGGSSAQFYITAQFHSNDTAPDNYSVKLFTINRGTPGDGTGGGDGAVGYNYGNLVSSLSISGMAADSSLYSTNHSYFSLSTGWYGFALTCSAGITAAASHIHIVASLVVAYG